MPISRSFAENLGQFHNLKPAALEADRWRVRYPYLYETFRRAGQLEQASEADWRWRTLLERAEVELFTNFEWVMFSADGRSVLHKVEAPGIEAIYLSAAETIALALHGYLSNYSEDGLPLYRVEEGGMIRVNDDEEFGVRAMTLRTLLKVARADAYPQPPTWASLLHHRRSDLYWHSLIAGDLWSPPGKDPPRDPVHMYDGRVDLKEESRRRMMIDQQEIRKAALHAVIAGQIKITACGFEGESEDPSHTPRAAAQDSGPIFDESSSFYSKKLAAAIAVWREAVKAKLADKNGMNQDSIDGIGVTEWMENWLKRERGLRKTPAEDIAKIASWAGRGRP